MKWLAVAAASLLVAAACSDGGADDEVYATVVADGLLNPIGMALLPDGTVLVAEEGTGQDDDSAGVSLIADGAARRVVSGLPSGRDSGDLSGVPLVGVAPDGSRAYTAHFGAGRLLTFDPPSSKAASTGAPLDPDGLGTAMAPLNRVELVNPFDITFDPRGVPVVTDASGNGVATENPDGTTTFLHRFGELRDPVNETRRIDAVPTGITRVGDEYYVTLTGGCPYPEGAGRLVAIDGARGERLVADDLDMPIDVALAPDGSIWVVEFARFDPDASCFTGEGYLPGTGRLGRLVGREVAPVVEGLDFPTSVLPMPDGSLWVASLTGTITRYSFTPPSDPEPAEALEWRFTDVAAAAGIGFRHGAFQTATDDDPVAAMGGGLCWIDFDRDGWLDLYLVNSHATAEAEYWEGQGGLPTNALYRNDEGRFVDVSAGSGADLAMRGNGCLAADLDGDGWTDLYVTADGPNALLVNRGDGTFEERAEAAGVAAPEWSTAAVAGDLNADGLLDIYVGSYIDFARTIDNPSGAFPQDYLGVADHLYLSVAAGSWLDATADAGLGREDRTLGALLSDLDRDGSVDLYVANDGQPNRLYLRAAGDSPTAVSFTDATRDAGVGDSGSGMGIAGGDYDGDRAFDLFVTNWEREPHALYRSLAGEGGAPAFVYSTFRIGVAGLGNGQTGWGTAWADFDHDTDLDLLIVNGMVPVTDLAGDRQLMRLYGNLAAEGEPGRFREWTAQSGLEAIGPLLGRGSAVADYDNDGDLDVAVNTIGGAAALIRNEAPPGGWLTIALEPFAPGALVRVVLEDGTEMVREARAGGSYLATEDPRLHFGLGAAERVASVSVEWPSGTVTTETQVAANQIVRLSPP